MTKGSKNYFTNQKKVLCIWVVYHLIDAIILNGMSRSKYIFLDTDTLKVVNGRVRVSNLALQGEI